jgi:hypothetical protein
MSNLRDFIDELQELEEHYKNKVPQDYIERIRDIWCMAEDEIEEPKVEETNYSESYNYNRYLAEVR